MSSRDEREVNKEDRKCKKLSPEYSSEGPKQGGLNLKYEGVAGALGAWERKSQW